MAVSGTHMIRVRYGESDQMGVVHHGAYITWFEACRIELLRELGCSYRALEERGVFMPVTELSVQYRRSLRFDDEARCVTVAEAKGPSRVQFITTIYLQETVCAIGTVTVAAVGKDGRPMRLPSDVVAAFTAQTATPSA
jgi:acyl-CoA thioester hydrolase